jgi:threonine/homoserine/homoserine lactone efflux protein
MTAETLGLLVIACLAVNLTPGPSVLLVTSVSAAHGFRAGLLAMLGMTAGAFLHILLAASGVAALLATAPLMFAIIQYLGAAYLIYLGIGLLGSRHIDKTALDQQPSNSSWHYFRRGFLIDTLNPKIALFFLAFIPQFLNSVENPGFLISVALGSVFLLTGAIVNGGYAWAAALGARRARGRYQHWLRCRIPGGVLVFLGLRLLWQE